jgi:hypothetical protein
MEGYSRAIGAWRSQARGKIFRCGTAGLIDVTRSYRVRILTRHDLGCSIAES